MARTELSGFDLVTEDEPELARSIDPTEPCHNDVDGGNAGSRLSRFCCFSGSWGSPQRKLHPEPLAYLGLSRYDSGGPQDKLKESTANPHKYGFDTSPLRIKPKERVDVPCSPSCR